jgi:hypothetical protein
MRILRSNRWTLTLGAGVVIAAVALLPISAHIASSAAAKTPTCTINQIRVALEADSGAYAAAGNEGNAFALINVSHAACSLEGYPKLEFFPSSYKGKSIRVTDNGGGEIFPAVPPRRVIIEPGATASYGINYGDAYNQSDAYSVGACMTQSVRARFPVLPHPYSVSQLVPFTVNFCFTNFHFGVTSIQRGPLPKTI